MICETDAGFNLGHKSNADRQELRGRRLLNKS